MDCNNIDPREINAIIALITNILYSELSKKDFLFFTVLICELGKHMESMVKLRAVCIIEKKLEKMEEKLDHKEKPENKNP